MVSKSSPWTSIASELRLVRDSSDAARPSKRVGLDAALEQRAAGDKDSVIDAATAAELERRFAALGTEGKALRAALHAGRMTAEQVLAALDELEQRGAD